MIKFSFKYTLLIITVLVSNLSFAQVDDGCDGARYRYLIYEDFEVEEDVVYGGNIDASGDSLQLVMDIYMPVGDSLTNRPVMVCAHGGFFMFGNNNYPDIVPICEDFARMGYVAVSISYRLGLDNWFNLQESLQEAVFRGVHDGKAAVRFLRKTHAEDENPYGIDPDRIMLGGSSAGAFIALHAAYVEVEEIPDYIDVTQPGLQGGLEGLSGNPGYSSDVLSIFSMSGAIGSAGWMDAGDVPVVSTHGTSDNTVPFGSGDVQFLFINIDQVDGSDAVHVMADSLSIENCFHPFDGAGHIPHASNGAYYDTTLAVISGFSSRMACPTYEPLCGWYDVTIPPEVEEEEEEIDCPQDLIVDGIISVPDVLTFLNYYGCEGECVGDFNDNGSVTASDILSLIALYGYYCE
jgi:para-nitrobenzyl esterase